MSTYLGKVVVGIALGIAVLALPPPAKAGGYRAMNCHETVVCHETRTVAYTKHVTRYDACGKPYSACVTCYRTIRVPVVKTIAVTKWIRVCD